MTNIMSLLQSFKQNPIPMLMSRRFNVPVSMASDPNAILQHLLSTGQVSQADINRTYQMAKNMKR